MSETNAAANAERKTTTPKYRVGDLIKIPCHSKQHYVAEVVKVYPDLATACELHERSFKAILQQPFGKVSPEQFFYYCEVANPTRKPVAVAEESVTLARAVKRDTVED